MTHPPTASDGTPSFADRRHQHPEHLLLRILSCCALCPGSLTLRRGHIGRRVRNRQPTALWLSWLARGAVTITRNNSEVHGSSPCGADLLLWGPLEGARGAWGCDGGVADICQATACPMAQLASAWSCYSDEKQLRGPRFEPVWGRSFAMGDNCGCRGSQGVRRGLWEWRNGGDGCDVASATPLTMLPAQGRPQLSWLALTRPERMSENHTGR